MLAIKVWKTFSNSEDGHAWARDMQQQDLLDANVYLVQMRRWLPLPPPNGIKAETGDPRVDEIVNAGREAATKATEEREARAQNARDASIRKEAELMSKSPSVRSAAQSIRGVHTPRRSPVEECGAGSGAPSDEGEKAAAAVEPVAEE